MTKSGSTSDSTGFTAGLSVPILDLINVNFGLSLTSTNTVKYSYTFSQTFSLPIPPGDTVNVEGYVENDVYAGTYQVWGTAGLGPSGDWTDAAPAPGVDGITPVDVVETYSDQLP